MGPYIHDGSAWGELSNQDSANTDAQTLTVDFDTSEVLVELKQ